MIERRSAHHEVRLEKDGEHSGERAARCNPPVFAAPGGKISSLQQVRIKLFGAPRQ